MSSTDLQARLDTLKDSLAKIQETMAKSAADRAARQPQLDQRHADMQSILDNLAKLNAIKPPVITAPTITPPVIEPK